MKKPLLLLVLISIFAYGEVFSQLSVTGGLTPQELAEILAGPDITVSNVTLTGNGVASGSFEGTSTNLGVNSGVILCTGNIDDAIGPNDQTNSGSQLGEPGTAQMDALSGADSHDAITLEFDFEVQSEMIQFNYVFASEEYPEYAPPNSSAYNDVFAFYISGPGITGEENIALIPGTSDPVAINNINAITNNQYYIDNTGGTSIELDAFTTILTAKKEGLTPCQTYTLKLVIADAGDEKYNSAVFLQENSLIQGVVNVLTQTVNADNIALEGCVNASFSFSLDQPLNYDAQIDYQIAGSATNGIDYEFIDNSVTIPEGQTEATIYIESIQDGIAEGQETILLIYKPEICSENDTAFLYIDDADPIVFTLASNDLLCFEDNSGEISVDATGGFPTYTYHVTDEDDNTNLYSETPITGMSEGTYYVQVYDTYGCKAEAVVVGASFDAGQTFLPDGSGVTYTSTIDISGFDAGQTLDELSQLQQICANLEHSFIGDLSIRVISPTGESVILKQYGTGGGTTNLGEPVATGPVDHDNSDITPGVGYDYCFNHDPNYGTMAQESGVYDYTYTTTTGSVQSDFYLPAGAYTSFEPLSNLLGSHLNGTWVLEVTDNLALDNGYIFSWNISLLSDLPDTVVVITEPEGMDVNGFVTQANCGGNDGAINISVNGNYPPFTYEWSNGETTEDIDNIGAGTYTVTVSDNNNCTQEATFNLNNISSINLTANISNVICNGGNDASIEITTSGGTSPYDFVWSNAAVTEDLTDLVVNDYTLTVTDDNGCEYIELFTISENPELAINVNSINDEICGTGNGSVDINVVGGTGSYGYTWSNGSNTEDIDNLIAGSYDIEVADGNNCTTIQSFTIINNVSNCSSYCYLDITDVNVTEDICGNGVGEIEITIVDVTAPYNIIWSNGATTEDLTGLTFGTYTVTINDAAGCETEETIIVGNNSGTLAITNSQLTNETCGNAEGGIDISVSGGTLPYSFSWSNSETTEDISTLSEGSYTIEISDGNNCLLSQSYDVGNNTGAMTVDDNVVNEICGNNQGMVLLDVSGANGIVSYNWSSGSTSQDLTNVSAGSYSVTITDGAGCSLTEEYFVLNNPGDLQLINSNVTNEICNNNLGAIDLTVAGGDGSYLYVWSGGETTEDLSGLNEGTFSCTITDGNSCEVNTGYIFVFNTPGDLEIETVFVTDEICGNQQGAVNINVTGGDSSYSYSWNNGSTSQDLANVNAGTYSLTVVDGNGCTATHEVTINNTSSDLSYVGNVVTDEICGNGQGAVDITIAGGTTPYAYSWSNGSSSQDINNLPEGNYSCTITDVNACMVEMSATVNNDASDLEVTYIATSEICSNTQGAIDITVTGGLAPYDYNWSNIAVTEDITNISASTYSCEITDQNSCVITTGDIEIINNPGNLNATVLVTDEICGNGTGEVDLTVTGGSGTNSYVWSNIETTEDITGLSVGIYICTVTDDNGCEVIVSDEVNNISGTLSLDNVAITNEMCDDNLGAIDITVSGGTGTIYYSWSNSGSTEDIASLNEGNYSCTITDDNGCEIITDVLVVTNEPGTLSLDNIVVNDENCSNGLGAINITVSGGVAPLSYLWSTTAITEDVNGLSAGDYTCTVTDDNGCEFTIIATVVNNSGTLSVVDAIIENEACGNGQGSIDITVQGGTIPYDFVWSTGAATEDLTNISEGTYACQIIDDNGCIATYSEDIENIGGDLAIVNSTVEHEICGNQQGAVDITVVGGAAPLNFNWSNGEAIEDLIGVGADTYTVDITDNNGCTTGASYVVNYNTGTLSLDNIVVTDDNCGDGLGAIDITYSGGISPITILWDNGATTEDLTVITEGTYTVTITGVNGCAVGTTETVQNISNGFAVSNITVANENCGDGLGSIDLTISGGVTPYNFNWSNGETTEDINDLSAGVYDCVITDANGCEISVIEEILNITTGINISNSYVSNEACNNGLGFIDLTVAGGVEPYSYAWSNLETTEDITELSTGTYSCVITDDNGCSVSAAYEVVNEGGDISVSYISTPEMCSGETGEIDITVEGGILPLSFVWDNGELTEDIINLPAGIYSVEVTDDVGCNASSTIEVENVINNQMGFSSVVVTDDYCGQSQGSIQVAPLMPGNYTYEINGVEHTLPFPIFTDLSSGIYVITILDENNCSSDSVINVGNTIPFNVEFTHIVDDNCGNNQGAIDMSVTPLGDYTFNWSNGVTTEDNYGISAGVYSCEISNTGGCVGSVSAEVFNETDIVITATVTDENCGDATGAIDITIVGGVELYSYNWSNGAGVEDISGLTAGIYTCTVTDDNECSSMITVEVSNITTGINISNVTIGNQICESEIGFIDITVEGGVEPYTYNWSNASIDEDLLDLSAGIYSCVVTDNSGCAINASYEVEAGVNNNFGFALISVDDDDCNMGTGSVTLYPQPSGTYTYEFDGVASEFSTFNSIYSGDYEVALIDENGCRVEDITTVSNSVPYQINFTHVVNDNCGNGEGVIDITVSPVDDYLFSWSNGMTTEDIFNLSAGTYSCTISNSAGCVDQFSVDIANETDIIATANVVSENCGDGFGEIDLTVSGGVGNYIYDWSNGDITEDISDLSAGLYTCTITDDNECSVVVEVEVTNNTGLLSVNSDVINDYCNEGNGAIDITLTGGSGNYDFNWSNGATTEDLSGLNQGDYSVVITDLNNNCMITQEFVIENNGMFNVIFNTITNASCSSCNDGAIDIMVNPSSGSYVYLWSNSETTEDVANLMPGEYTVTITDINDCVIVETYTVDFFTEDNQLVTEDFDISVYPNPTSGDLNIVLGDDYSDYNVKIMDVTGKLLFTIDNVDTQNIYVDLNDFVDGVYLVKLQSEIHQKVVKLIKQ